jgi:hypothetical protein
VEPDIIGEVAEKGTLPQSKGGYTEDTESKIDVRSFAGLKNNFSVSSFYLCALCGIVT